MNKGQQALNTLREKGYTNHFQPITLEQQYPNEFKTLQELVDKATPKKPKQFGNNGYCPKCHYLVHSFYEYCCWCGQKLDWSDEDDK